MSMTAVLSYFKTSCEALGYKEHDDVFNYENIPSTRLGSTFVVELGDFTRERHDPALLTFSTSVTVRLFTKPARNTREARTQAVAMVEELTKECAKSFAQSGGLKAVFFNDSKISALSQSNDNVMMIETSFTALGALDIGG